MSGEIRDYSPSNLAGKFFGLLLVLGGGLFFVPLLGAAMQSTLTPGSENVVYFVFMPMTMVMILLGLLVVGYSDGTKIDRKKGYVQSGFRIFTWAKEGNFPLEQFREVRVIEETHTVQNPNGSRYSHTNYVVRLTGPEIDCKPSVGTLRNQESALQRAEEVAEFLNLPIVKVV